MCAAALTLVATAGCTAAASTPSPAPAPAPSDVVASLGAVPIPSAPRLDPVPTASAGHAQVLAMGAPVRAVLGGGAAATVTATGPVQATDGSPTGSAGPPGSTRATITLSVAAVRGTFRLAAADLSCRDDTGKVIRLRPVDRPVVPVSAGRTAVVRVSGVFGSGAAQVTWRHAGRPIALWVFTVELD